MAGLSISELLKDTSDFGTTFEQGNGVEVEVFADAGYVSKATGRRSVSGGDLMCGGGAVN